MLEYAIDRLQKGLEDARLPNCTVEGQRNKLINHVEIVIGILTAKNTGIATQARELRRIVEVFESGR